MSIYWICLSFVIIMYVNSADSCNFKSTSIMDSVYLPVNQTITDEPSIVSIRQGNLHYCSGAIVSTQHVLTSAYCVCYLTKEARKILRVVMGVSTSNEFNKATTLNVKKISCYPSKKGDPRRLPDLIDIALIEVKEGILFGPKHRIAKLPFFYKPPKLRDYCYFLGWNSAPRKFSITNYPLQSLHLTMFSIPECAATVQKRFSQQFVYDHFECGIKEQYDFTHLLDPRYAIETYNWLEFGAPFFCNDVLLGIMRVPFFMRDWPQTDKVLYIITRIEPLYQFFKNVIPEYTPVES